MCCIHAISNVPLGTIMDALEEYLHTYTDLSSADRTLIRSLALPKRLRRNEFLLREGEVCRYKIFVEKGLLRTFGTAADGSEHILHFAAEQQWTLDAESYDTQQPARYNIAAVENSDLLLWVKADFDSLVENIPSLKKFSHKLISRSNYSSRDRLLTALSATPEEKYQDFVNSFPHLLPRLPLRMIAAYLGISIKTLTRIRQAQLRR